MFIYILLWIFLLTVVCQGQYSIWPDESLWTKSVEKCPLATPKVDAAISSNQSAFRIASRGIDIPVHETVWVGYYQVVRVFEYIGCIAHRTIFHVETPQFVQINGDPGQCFLGCGESSFIGVTRTRCYCLGHEFMFTEKTETGCTDLCNHPLVACGKDNVPDIYSFLSVYRINTDVTASAIPETPPFSAEGKYCLKLDLLPPKTFYWDGCHLSYNAMCFFGNRTQNEKCKFSRPSDFCSWKDAANTCFNDGKFPTLYWNSRDFDKGNMSQAWTGLFKTIVTYRYNAKVPVQRQHDNKQYGFLKKESGGEIIMKFTNSDSMKKVLCQVKNRNNDLTTRVSQAPTGTEAARNQTTSPKTFSKDQSTTDGANPVIYIAIGAGVLVLLVLVLLVAVLILLTVLIKRRRKQKNQIDSRSNVETSHQISEDHHDYTDLALPNSQRDSHNYFTLEAGGTENVEYDTVI